jgi:hypothetical protein
MGRPRVDGDSHSGQSTDEAFLSKGSSQEELDNNNRKDFADSDEYVAKLVIISRNSYLCFENHLPVF